MRTIEHCSFDLRHALCLLLQSLAPGLFLRFPLARFLLGRHVGEGLSNTDFDQMGVVGFLANTSRFHQDFYAMEMHPVSADAIVQCLDNDCHWVGPRWQRPGHMCPGTVFVDGISSPDSCRSHRRAADRRSVPRVHGKMLTVWGVCLCACGVQGTRCGAGVRTTPFRHADTGAEETASTRTWRRVAPSS